MNDIKNDKCDFCGGDATYLSIEGYKLCDTCAYVLPAGLIDVKMGKICLMTIEQLKDLAEANFKYNTPNLDLVRAQINKMVPKKCSLELEDRIVELTNEKDTLQKKLDEVSNIAEQWRVKLAGCSTAALGWSKGSNLAQRGSYGWSQSYQDVLDFRQKYEEGLRTIDILKQERNNWETLAGQYRFKAEILEEENEGLEKEVEDLDEENEELNEENEELDQKVTQLTNELNVANFQKMQLESSVEKLSKSIEFYRKLALDTAKFKLIYNCPAW